VIGIAAHQRRQIECDAEASAARLEQATVAFVGLFRRPEPGKLPHRPELAAIAGGVNAACVWELSWIGNVTRVLDRRDAVGSVPSLDGPLRVRAGRGPH
jgi:hypothetical protein